jgi:SAM-dependent methyltransferase
VVFSECYLSIVESQYRDASNLNARIALHERFSANGYGWQRWVFDQLELPSEARLLELGCGPGGLWKENLDRVPEGWSVTLTDASPGMLREAERDLGADRRFRFCVADARELPFEDGSFDAVIANHVLHHVPERSRAISEAARVLSRGGIFYAATSGRCHLREMNWMLRVLDPAHPDDGLAQRIENFSLGNGAAQLSPPFSGVSFRQYEDALVVTEAKPLVNYALSTPTVQETAERTPQRKFRERMTMLNAALERELASQGAIHITKDTGLFVVRP